jgi:sugar phosphate isomerase/epimerase
MIFLSTTFYKKNQTNLETVLKLIKNLDIEGVEIGSTHKFQKKKQYINFIKKYLNNKKIFIHNFFPPLKNKNFLLNIASEKENIRKQSVDFAIKSIDFCKKVNAELYTVHPGFLSDGIPSIDNKNKCYDFSFQEIKSSYRNAFNNMIDSLKVILKYSKKKNINLAIETEGSMLKYSNLLMQTPNEFIRLFSIIPKNLFINLNLAHSLFASKIFKFSLKKFINKFKNKIYCVELSYNNGFYDQHLPFKEDSQILEYLNEVKSFPKILEFRNANITKIKKNIKIISNFA